MPTMLPNATADPLSSLGKLPGADPFSLERLVNAPRVAAGELISSGCAELDGALQRRGLARGTLLESLGKGTGAGATFLAVASARQALTDGGALVVVDLHQAFYPLGVERLGIAAERVVLVRPSTQREALWACEQALRSAGVAAVLSWPEYLTPLSFRRLQLAAEEGGTLGLLVRSARVQPEPSWADVRWLVSPAPSEAGRRRFSVEVLRGQSRKNGALLLEADDEGALCMVSQVANPTLAGRERRA